MNQEIIKTELSNIGWNSLHKGTYKDIEFDIIGSRTFVITSWKILVKFIPILDKNNLQKWNENFIYMSKKNKSMFLGKCFLLFLIVDEIKLDILPNIEEDNFGFLGVFRFKGGGGNIIVANINSKQVYCKIPIFPYDLNLYSNSIVNKIKFIMNNNLLKAETPYSVIKNNIVNKGSRKLSLFISYSHKDEDVKNKIDTHLSSLKRSEKIETWNDVKIEPGSNWDEKIKKELDVADIILLLISANFIASDYIWNTEIKKAIERDEKKEAVVIPIFCKTCDYKDMPFAKLQGLPFGAKSLNEFNDIDVGLTEIATGIGKIIDNIIN